MIRIAIANRKGGTGKTTTTINLASALAQNGHRPLVVDLDPQGNASYWLGVEGAPSGSFDVMVEGKSPNDHIIATDFGIDLLAATKNLTSADRLLEMEAFGQNEKLKEALAPTSRLMLFDCPANFGRTTMNALTAATHVLIPVEASDMAVDGMVDLLSAFQSIRQYHNDALALLGILVCLVDHRTNHDADVISVMRKKFGQRVFDTTIARNVAVKDSYRQAEPVVTARPSARAAKEYSMLALEIEEAVLQPV